jgi:nickel transport protein
MSHFFNPKSKIRNPKFETGVYMKIAPLKMFIVILFCLWVLPMFIGPASAHRVNVFAWVEGDTIYVESKFSGGKKVNAAKIIVMDPRGVELLSGRTNDQGEFSFKVPKPTDLKIVLVAGQGHQGEWTVRAAEIADMPSGKAPETSAENAIQSDQNDAVFLKPVDSSSTAPDIAVEPKELEAIIESILDKKLKPITRMLADIRQKGPTVADIFAGIGYIFGLVGIAAYVHSRKKKE